MSQHLPEYLRMHADATPCAGAAVRIGDVRVTVITPRLLRIEQGAFTDDATLTVVSRSFCPCEFSVSHGETGDVIETGALRLCYQAGQPLKSLTITGLTHPAFVWQYGQKPMQNLKGTTSTLDTVDGACPLEDGICALDGFTFIDDSQSPRMTADGWFAGRESCTDVYFFGYGHDYTAAVQDYQRLTGVPGMLPAFALGNWWSRYHAYTDKEYLTLMDEFRRRDVPLAVGIVDMDWHLTDGDGRNYFKDGWTGYTWNDKLFPDYHAFLNALHDRGLKTALNLHPASGVRPWETQYEDMCRALGKDPAEKKPVPFNCLNPDFLKAYFEVLHFPYEKDGVDFWWMDWQQGRNYPHIAGEDYVPSDIESITPLRMLNHMHYLASQRDGHRGMIFSRYSGAGSQRYPIGFSGDTYITWPSLKFQPYFTATASNVGYGWWSHDIGGHMGGIRDDEMTARWVQLGVFSPIFRLHSTRNLFTGREPWKYNRRAEQVMSDCMRLRHQLFPYLYTMNRRAHAELLPLVRPMYHTHPECADAYQVPDEYWFGSEMIAAPITDPADESDLAPADVWLPEGIWTDMTSGYVYKGDQRLTVYRPLEEIPVFLKGGAIVPMQGHHAQDNTLGHSADMHVLVAPGASNAFRLYEDDGESLAYADGGYAETPLTLDWSENAATFTIGAAVGDASLLPDKRSWTVHFRGWRKGCAFTVNGESCPATYSPADNTYTVTLVELSACDSVVIAISHTDGLTHDNSDARDKAIERITRAQMLQDDKRDLLKLLDDEIARNLSGEASGVLRIRLRTDRYPSLGGYLFELVAQMHLHEGLRPLSRD